MKRFQAANDWMTCGWWRCGLSLNYSDHLLFQPTEQTIVNNKLLHGTKQSQDDTLHLLTECSERQSHGS